uniref:Ribosome biogenesis protein NOP53 n=1 Tax=Tetradesmus obliquus TaxID=3088 RepID=A0A383VBQ1_TETOB
MGGPKTKTSRKGKKAWRKNIDASEIQTFLQDEGHKQQREPAVQTLKDEELFVLDKAADDSAVPAAVRRQSKRREQKPLRSQLILDSLRDGITPLQQASRKPKEAGRPLPNSKPAAAGAAAAVVPAAAAQPNKRRRRQQQGPVTDLWADEAAAAKDGDWTSHASGNELLRLAQLAKQQQQQAAAAAAAKRSGSSKRKRPAPAPIAAVEVDLPGCSFNPEYEAHQDALAVAVAREYKQQLKEELAPKAPSLFAPAGYKPGDELEELLADAEADDDDKQQQQQQQALPAAAADENEIAIDADDDDATAADAAIGQPIGKAAAAAASRAADKKTRKDRNKEARKKQQELEAEAKRQLKRQRQQLEALPVLQQQLAEEEEEQRKVQERRQVVKQEKAAIQPPRLGKHKWEAPAPEVVKQEKAAIQPPRLGKHKWEAPAPEVLTSDQIGTGSLRRLQPCFLVTEDRFKALQKRGLIEPRKRAGQKAGRKVEYVTGERREKAEERQQEVREMTAARKKAAKAGKGNAAAVQGLLKVAGGGVGKKPGKQQGKKGQQGGQAAAAAVAEPGLVMPLAVGGDDGGCGALDTATGNPAAAISFCPVVGSAGPQYSRV